MIAIPNIEMPKSCWDCELLSSCKAMPKNPTADEVGTYTVMRLKDCPLIEVDDELMIKLQESAIVIKAVFNRLKKKVNDSDELKAELMGLNPNLTIFDEDNADQCIQCVESVGERRNQ